MAPKVLVSDKLSETAVQIFRDRGIDVDFEPSLGKNKEKNCSLSSANMMVLPYAQPQKLLRRLSTRLLISK